MTLATKAELRDDVGAWLNRTGEADFLARFDSWLALCEADFGKKLKADVTERRLVATINERWENLPTGARQVRSVAILSGTSPNTIYQTPSLPFLSYQEAIKAYGKQSSAPVKAYTLVGTQIGFFPFPEEDLSSTLQFELISYVRPDPLLLDTDNNEVLTEYPAIYLYGVLVQTAPYYGRDEDLVKWSQAYEAAIAEANIAATDMPGDILIERVA